MNSKASFLDSFEEKRCCGCEACKQVCPNNSISMLEDREGFRYPTINYDTCLHCNSCRFVCPLSNDNLQFNSLNYAYGGYLTNKQIRFDSTSGGAFSAIATAFYDDNCVIFGAESKGIEVFHSYVTDSSEIDRFRKSKYSQSSIGDSYKKVKSFLKEGKKVLFSGTPCQIAGLTSYLKNVDTHLLLTVEVVCEGVPSPLYIRKMQEMVKKKFGCDIKTLDYRYKGKSFFRNGKWDFQIMKTITCNNKRIQKDRWFNPFWSIWLQHLMTRPSCYECKFAKRERLADITLGDLWGVHLYCKDLYGKNGGSSLVLCNTEKGRNIFEKAKEFMFGRELDFEEAVKYQSPLRKHIVFNDKRDLFMRDLESEVSFDYINRKWAKKPSLKLLWKKYIWGNRQKVALWNIFHKRENRHD